MKFNVGDKIIYEDVDLNLFKGEIVDIWRNDDEETTAYFVVTDSGLYIHFKPSSLEWCSLDESVPGPREYASNYLEFE
ncbi:MAG TPA: hypothetical protein G4O15_13255 [Dehalococcoidia bacterium]|nr:hypothetical protein [Dehalococcoidia bacterium]